MYSTAYKNRKAELVFERSYFYLGHVNQCVSVVRELSLIDLNPSETANTKTQNDCHPPNKHTSDL